MKATKVRKSAVHILDWVCGLVNPAARRDPQPAAPALRFAVSSNGKLPEHDAADLFGLPRENLQREHELVLATRLSPVVEAWFQEYSRVGHRTRYLWQWCVHGADLTTLPSVLPELRVHVCETKVLSIMLCVLLDDVADEQDKGRLLEALLKVVDGQSVVDLEGFSDEDQTYIEVTRTLSEEYRARIGTYPCFEVFEELLQYDQMQYFNTMRYSYLLNRQLHLLNVAEHDLYLPHAMHMMSFATLDLMCTPGFEVHELGRLREALWHLQCMGRVGNLLATWRREIPQRDFTSGVFARAVAAGDVTIEQLMSGEPRQIEAAIQGGDHEQHFFRHWEHHRECFRSKVDQVRSVDLPQLLAGHERFFYMHLGSRGLI